MLDKESIDNGSNSRSINTVADENLNATHMAFDFFKKVLRMNPNQVDLDVMRDMCIPKPDCIKWCIDFVIHLENQRQIH